MAPFVGEKVPTLDEVMSWARAAGVTLSLEIKQPTAATGRPKYPRIAEGVADMLASHGLVERALVRSFDHPTIRHLRDLLPRLATAINYGGATLSDPLMLARAADASGLHAWWAWVSPEVCQPAHQA